jgi:hypothetical protein
MCIFLPSVDRGILALCPNVCPSENDSGGTKGVMPGPFQASGARDEDGTFPTGTW